MIEAGGPDIQTVSQGNPGCYDMVVGFSDNGPLRAPVSERFLALFAESKAIALDVDVPLIGDPDFIRSLSPDYRFSATGRQLHNGLQRYQAIGPIEPTGGRYRAEDTLAGLRDFIDETGLERPLIVAQARSVAKFDRISTQSRYRARRGCCGSTTTAKQSNWLATQNSR